MFSPSTNGAGEGKLKFITAKLKFNRESKTQCRVFSSITALAIKEKRGKFYRH
jgi:hypothetical protein